VTGALQAASLAQANLSQDRTKAVPATRQASCLLRVSSDVHTLPLDDKTVFALVTSTGVLQEAVNEVLGPQSLGMDDFLNINFTRVSPGQVSTAGPQKREQTFVGKLELDIFDDEVKPAATELLRRICERLTAEIGTVLVPERERLQRQSEQTSAELERAKDRVRELQALQHELWRQAGRSDLSSKAIQDLIGGMERQRDSAEMQLVAKKARADALAEQIAKIGAEVEAALKKDEIAGELQMVVDLRMKELSRVKTLVDKGLATDADVGAAMQSVALAKAELAKYQQELAQTAGGALLADLNSELVRLAVDTAEMQVQLAFVQSQLQEIKEKNLLELADRYEREVAFELHLAERAAEQAIMDRNELEAALRDFREPTITVIGGN